MKRVIFFIDGFNIYHAINNKRLAKYKWLDYSKLANNLISQNVQKVTDIYFFTALAHWNKNKVRRHSVYINALKKYNIKIIKGKFRKKDKYCRHCKKTTKTFEEKETDVNIALFLLKLAYKNQYDVAMILSGDSDLFPAINEVKKEYPKKEFIIVIPPNRKAERLKSIADKHIKLKEYHLQNNQLPNEVIRKDGTKILKPKEWN